MVSSEPFVDCIYQMDSTDQGKPNFMGQKGYIVNSFIKSAMVYKSVEATANICFLKRIELNSFYNFYCLHIHRAWLESESY